MSEHGHGRDSECSVSWTETTIADFRWATEDPNPGGKAAEDKRIAQEGRRVIASKLDDNLIEASQTLRALEDGDIDDLYEIEQQPDAVEARPAKRSKTEDSRTAPTAGLLGGDTLENIKYYAELARKQAEEDRNRKVPAKSAMGLLSGYGSDEDSD